MKSVVAEASSISKAVELAWQKAGQPKEFLVKVFQEPQRNMFGLTKTSAKVGIFFDDAVLTQKIKNASASSLPAGHAAKQITPISPIKPLDGNRPQTPRQAKPQPKVVTQPVVQNNPAVKPVETSTPVINNPVSKNAQAARPNSNRRNHPANRPASKPNNRPNPENTRPNIASNHPINKLPEKAALDLPTEQSLVDQVINLIANESKTRSVKPTTNSGAVNPVAADGTATPKPARNRYYHRRKPRSARPNTGEGQEQHKPSAPSNKNED